MRQLWSKRSQLASIHDLFDAVALDICPTVCLDAREFVNSPCWSFVDCREGGAARYKFSPLHRIGALPKGLDMSPSDKIVLNNGSSIPRLGLGVYQSGRGRASGDLGVGGRISAHRYRRDVRQ